MFGVAAAAAFAAAAAVVVVLVVVVVVVVVGLLLLFGCCCHGPWLLCHNACFNDTVPSSVTLASSEALYVLGGKLHL